MTSSHLPSDARPGPSWPAWLPFLVTLLMLSGTGCIAPMARATQQPPATQDPNVAVQKEWTPSLSIQRGAVAIPYLDGRALRESVEELSSRRFEGRLTGTRGYERAARWAAARFAAAGLIPGGVAGSWFEPFEVEANEVTGPVSLSIRLGTWEAPGYSFGVDYVARGFSGSGRIQDAPVVYVGYGLRDPESGRDDFAGAQVSGKVVLMLMGAPRGGRDWGEMARPRYKATIAAGLGARAILFLDDPGPGAPSPIGSVYHGQVGSQQPDLPQLSIRDEVADDLLRGLPWRAETLRRQTVEGTAKLPVDLRTRVSLEVGARYDPAATTWNVVAWLEGSDPSVASEYVIVGGHLDHVGSQAGVLFAGAKDNASGSVMVVSLAQALARSPVRPRRSICFVLFAGEELFLLGSEQFRQNPPRPLRQAVGMINLDVVGVGPSLRLEGGATTPAYQQMAVDADRLYGGFGLLEQTPSPAEPGASDHSAFIEAGVPTLYFHSGGAPGRAHTPADVAGTIDYDAYLRTARVVCLTLFQIADRP